MSSTREETDAGFTLIELSIVLVIIGLIVGGVLVGQNLIAAAGVRAQVTQIEKFQSATATFYGKYGGLPGDLNATAALQFGFIARGANRGDGDGNGLIEGTGPDGSGNAIGSKEGAGETAVFWVDLSAAKLIEGTFTTANETTLAAADVTGAAVSNYLPPAKIGGGNYVSVWSGGATMPFGGFANNNTNYFAVDNITTIASQSNFGFPNAPVAGLTVAQANAMDSKVDDGLPTTGNVTAMFATGIPSYGASGSSSTCFDNSTGTYKYSVQISNGALVNCALSFKFQTGD